MRPPSAPIGEGLRAAILELYARYPPPPAGSGARSVWWSTLVRALGQVAREVDRAGRARERETRAIPGSAR